MSKRERDALISAFVALKTLSENSLTPTGASMAREGAGNCVCRLGYDSLHGVDALAPHGPVIEGDVPGGTDLPPRRPG